MAIFFADLSYVVPTWAGSEPTPTSPRESRCMPKTQFLGSSSSPSAPSFWYSGPCQITFVTMPGWGTMSSEVTFSLPRHDSGSSVLTQSIVRTSGCLSLAGTV